MQELKSYIEKYTSISSYDWEVISQSFTQQKIAKNEMLLQEGKICRYFYFIESGLLRYFYNVDGNDIVKTFIFPSSCFTSEASFVNRLPAKESIQSIEASVVWKTSYEQYQKLEKLSSWRLFTNSLLNEIDAFTRQMIIHLKSLTPEQRYYWLLENYSQSLMQRIPQKYLASFLGVAPQSLCRIKNKLLGKAKVSVSG